MSEPLKLEVYNPPKFDPNWKCYLFGNTPKSNVGFVIVPGEGDVPNKFVRWMMKVCFACTWVDSRK